MNDMQLFPFERNRYYMGKMLTSSDFKAEQSYVNNKRRFMNHMMLGAGILCGMGVFNLDDLSILIESGVAVDYLGREIIIENSVVQKISAIKGYDKLVTDKISLCLRYREEEIHPVYAVSRRDNQNEYEYNRIREGYELFLVDTDSIEKGFQLDREFLLKEALLDHEDYRIYIVMPATVCKGKKVKISIEIEKCSAADKNFGFTGVLQLPFFKTGQGEKELSIDIKGVKLMKGETYSADYWLYCQRNYVTETSLILKTGTGSIIIGEECLELPQSLEVKIAVSKLEPEELIALELGKASLELQSTGLSQDFVRLAELDMAHTDHAYIINNIDEMNIKNYIPLPARELERAHYLSYYGPGQWDHPQNIKPPGLGAEEQVTESEQAIMYQLPNTASGSIDIPLEVRMKKGGVCFSEEVVHGLGPGSVYVAVGIEELEEGVHTKRVVRSTVYGNVSLFEGQGAADTWMETGVKVFHDRGSFRAAAKLVGEQRTILLSLQWIAVKIPDPMEDIFSERSDKMKITPETATVRLAPKEKYYFGVEFHNMQPCSLLYELTESNSGEISPDGLYTPPARQGVFEIRIACEDYPSICTYSYAVV